MRSGLLLLADSRLPSGGHGHSGGVEALVDRGLLRSEADLAAFLAGRIATGAAVPAAARPRRACWPVAWAADEQRAADACRGLQGRCLDLRTRCRPRTRCRIGHVPPADA